MKRPSPAVRSRVERLAKANPGHGYVALALDGSSPELEAVARLAALTGMPVPVVVDGIEAFVLPPDPH